MFRMMARMVLVFGLCTPPLFFANLYYVMHWRWRDCFNEEGRCYDEASNVIYHEQSGLIYFGLFVASLLIPAVGFWIWSRRGRGAK